MSCVLLHATAEKLNISSLEVFYKAAVANCYIDANKIANEWIQQYQSFRGVHVDVVDFCYQILRKEEIEQEAIAK